MKLWQAIEAGSKDTRQITGTFQDYTGGVCAQGAALKAINHLDSYHPHAVMSATWPRLATRVEPCPAGCDLHGPLLGRNSRLIAHLNNHHLWTFQQIIDWLKTIEGEEQP